jgi:RNA polymerase subunit RPABC4/transcription elongation factor Spt4
METNLNQKAINAEIFNYLHEIEKKLDREHTLSARVSIISEIENHLREKMADLERSGPITKSILETALAEFGKPEEIVREYVPSKSEKAQDRLAKFFTWSRAFYNNISPNSITGEYSLFMTCAVFLLLSVSLFSLVFPWFVYPIFWQPDNPYFGDVWVQNLQGIVYITWIVGIVLIAIIFRFRPLNPYLVTRQGDGWATVLGRAYEVGSVKIWQPLLFYGLLMLVPIGISRQPDWQVAGSPSLDVASVMFLYALGLPVLMLFTDYRGHFVEQGIAQSKKEGNSLFYSNLERKRHALFKGVLEFLFVFVIGCQSGIALCFYIYGYISNSIGYLDGKTPFPPRWDTGFFVYVVFCIAIMAYLIARHAFSRAIKRGNTAAAKASGVLKLSCTLLIEMGYGIFILGGGPLAVILKGDYYTAEIGTVFLGGNNYFSSIYQFSQITPLHAITTAIMFFVYCLFAFKYFRLQVAEGMMRLAALVPDQAARNDQAYHDWRAGYSSTQQVAMLHCVRCNSEMSSRFKYCPECGQPVASVMDDAKQAGKEAPLTCPKCNAAIPEADGKFCPECGERVK